MFPLLLSEPKYEASENINLSEFQEIFLGDCVGLSSSLVFARLTAASHLDCVLQ